MLGWSSEQRALFAETLRDIANVAVGAMVFGQFLSERAFSAWQAIVGVAVWGTGDRSTGIRRKETTMTGLVILLGGITLIAVILTVLDGIDYRRQQRSGKK